MKRLLLLALSAVVLVTFSPADPPPAGGPWEQFQNPAFRDAPNGVEL